MRGQSVLSKHRQRYKGRFKHLFIRRVNFHRSPAKMFSIPADPFISRSCGRQTFPFIKYIYYYESRPLLAGWWCGYCYCGRTVGSGRQTTPTYNSGRHREIGSNESPPGGVGGTRREKTNHGHDTVYAQICRQYFACAADGGAPRRSPAGFGTRSDTTPPGGIRRGKTASGGRHGKTRFARIAIPCRVSRDVRPGDLAGFSAVRAPQSFIITVIASNSSQTAWHAGRMVP